MKPTRLLLFLRTPAAHIPKIFNFELNGFFIFPPVSNITAPIPVFQPLTLDSFTMSETKRDAMAIVPFQEHIPISCSSPKVPSSLFVSLLYDNMLLVLIVIWVSNNDLQLNFERPPKAKDKSLCLREITNVSFPIHQLYFYLFHPQKFGTIWRMMLIFLII